MISNADYLIQKYAEAREKMMNSHFADFNYWKGSMDTYHSLLNIAFEGWAAPDTTGWYVFYEQMTYDEALNAVSKLVENC